jgi:exodeoxyribonuclease V alpha subunit
MAKHISLRLPWHDRGWDGHVCDKPTANVFCTGEYGLKAHGIRDRKVDSEEEKDGIRGCPVAGFKPDSYFPPCLRTIQTFGGTKDLKFVHEPKSFLSTGSIRVQALTEKIPPFTAGTWPYDRVFRRAEEAEEETPEQFIERYSPVEAVENLNKFFNGVQNGRSLVFFYLNYDNPLNSERRKYVLVGAAEIENVSKQLHWERIDEKIASVYGSMVWNRFVTHAYGQGRGARMPYELYLKGSHEPSDVIVEVEDDMSQHFKYVCRHFSDDEAAVLLRNLLSAFERGKAAKLVDWPWDNQIRWINEALDRVLKDRGAFPGLAGVLGVLGFNNPIGYVGGYIVANGIQDGRQHVLDRLSDLTLAETADLKSEFRKARNTLRVLPKVTRDLLLDRLCLFELTMAQMRMIAGGGLVNDADRREYGLSSDPGDVLANPYLIIEEYDPPERDDRIQFHRIDHGLLLPRATYGINVPGLDEFTADDKRRMRAASVVTLRSAARDGHSFLPQEDLLTEIARRRLIGLPESIGPVIFARDLDFYQECLSLLEGADFTGWMLVAVAEDEELIRSRIQKLLRRNAVSHKIKDWSSHIPENKQLPSSLRKQIRENQSSVLGRLASQAISVLIGSAGTGKTTVVATLIKALIESGDAEKFVLLAPTGKAAVRLRQKIKEIANIDLEPRTIHSYLLQHEWMKEDSFRPVRDGTPIQDGATTIVVDECSMLDTVTLATIIRAIDWTSKRLRRVILSGDPQQLPPIDTGAPFKNIVDHLSQSSNTNETPCSLTVNCRQVQEHSTALRFAEQFTDTGSRLLADELLDQIRHGGRVGRDLEVRFFQNEADLPQCLADLVKDAIDELLQMDGSSIRYAPEQPWIAYDELHGFNMPADEWRLDAFEVLSPYRGNYFGSDKLNQQLQDMLRGKLLKGTYTLKLGKPSGKQFIAPDKILQIRNFRIKERTKLAWDGRRNVDLYIANGELGRVTKIDKWKGDKFARIRFETNPTVTVKIDQSLAEEDLDLGYAMSVHKAQGSDFGGVIVIIPKEPRLRLVSRELLYTALTRFTRRLYILIQGARGDVESLIVPLWRGSSAFLRRNTCLYLPRRAIADIDDYRPGKRMVRTLRDELVMSKSEALIANQLAANKIPYYYEKLLRAPDGSPRRPDFTIPIETAEGPDELYWEHWGKLGDPVYDESVRLRREWYQTHGYAPKLIETNERGGFDSKKIEKVIRDRILS